MYCGVRQPELEKRYSTVSLPSLAFAGASGNLVLRFQKVGAGS